MSDNFKQTMMDAGLTPPDYIEAGRIHRFPGCEKSNGNKAGWCMLFDDGEGGVFGDWSTDLSESWQEKKAYSNTEYKAFKERAKKAKQQAAQARVETQAESAITALEAWNKATPETGQHKYLLNKNIDPHGIRTNGFELLIPLYDNSRKLCSLQSINPNGDKLFHKGGQVKGCYFPMGKPNGVMCLAEGFATAATVHEATGHAVAVCFNAGNLQSVAESLSRKYKTTQFIVCADNDHGAQHNTGLIKAGIAAASCNGVVAVPDEIEGVTDFNDMARLRGNESVCAVIKAAVEKEPEPATYVRLLSGGDIKPEPITWLWHEWLAAGKLHILAGAPGTGKTTIALAFAAAITTGGRWPDGSQAEMGDVVIWSGEDDPKDTLIPRLLACGADVSRVHFIDVVKDEDGERSFNPAHDTIILREAINRLDRPISLLIVDPVVSAVAGDSHKNAEVRRALQPIVDLSQSLRCVALGISHFSKGTAGRDPVDRVTGSLAFGALARVVMAAAKLQESEGGGRILARAKSNIGPDSGGFYYDLEQKELEQYPGLHATQLLWGEAIEGTARDLLARAETVNEPEEHSALEEAKEFLDELLSNGAVSVKHIKKESNDAGHSWITIRRAKEMLKIVSTKEGFEKGWKWEYPSKVFINTKGVHTNEYEHVGEIGAPSTKNDQFEEF